MESLSGLVTEKQTHGNRAPAKVNESDYIKRENPARFGNWTNWTKWTP